MACDSLGNESLAGTSGSLSCTVCLICSTRAWLKQGVSARSPLDQPRRSLPIVPMAPLQDRLLRVTYLRRHRLPTANHGQRLKACACSGVL